MCPIVCANGTKRHLCKSGFDFNKNCNATRSTRIPAQSSSSAWTVHAADDS